MFYLKTFFHFLYDLKLRGFFLFLFTFFMTSSLIFKPKVDQYIDEFASSKSLGPYFTLMLDKHVSLATLKDALINHYQVKAIEKVTQEQTQPNLMRLIKKMGGEYQGLAEALPRDGLKVFLSNSASERTKDKLLQDVGTYLRRGRFSTSPLRYPDAKMQLDKHPYFKFFNNFQSYGVTLPLFLCWVVCLCISYNLMQRKSFLIEMYQRRQMVLAKVLGAGFGLIFVIQGVVAYQMNMIDMRSTILAGIILFTFLSLVLRNSVWKNS